MNELLTRLRPYTANSPRYCTCGCIGLFGPRKMTMHIRQPLASDPRDWGWRDDLTRPEPTHLSRRDPKYWSILG